MRLAPIAALFGAAAVAGGCGGSVPPASSTPANLPNIAAVQSGIVQTISKYDHVSARVYCPQLVPQVAGQTFTCIGVATRPRVQTFVFTATVHSGTLVSWARTG